MRPKAILFAAATLAMVVLGAVATPQQAAQQPTKQQQYRIGLRDVITVAVWNEPKLSGDSVVGPEGKITLRSGQEIAALGLNLDELKKVVIEALVKHLKDPKDPQVAVALKKMASR